MRWLAAILVVWLWVPAVLAGTPAVAVLDLANRTGDPALDATGPGVAGILAGKLARLEAITVVERTRLAEVLAEIELGASGAVDASTAARAGKVIGADYMVVGELVAAKLPTIAVVLRVIDAETAEVVLTEEVRGEVGERGEQFFVIIDELAFRVIDAMKVRLAARDRIELGQIDVRELGTVSVFGEALEALDRGDLGAAETLLSRALAMEPGFRLADATLERLAVELAGRGARYAHAAIREVHERWDRLAVEVDGLAKAEDPTIAGVAAMALRARVYEAMGDYEPALALEARRAELMRTRFDAIAAGNKYPQSAFETAIRDRITPLGSEHHGRYYHRIPFWPLDIDQARARLLCRLGRQEQAIALVLSSYQHASPRSSPDPPRFPDGLLEDLGAWDARVVLLQQRLRQAELGGRATDQRKAERALESAVRDAGEARQVRAEAAEALRRLEAGTLDVKTLIGEWMFARATKRTLPDELLRGYRAWLTRARAGGYGSLPRGEASRWEDLCEAWMESLMGVFDDAWDADRRLEALLAYQELVPPRDDEHEERYEQKLQRFIEGAYRP